METNQEIDFFVIPVRALRPRTRDKLCCMLNRKKLLMSPCKLPRDYRGLDDLMHTQIGTNWFPEDNYTRKLLLLWEKEKPEEANLGTLRKFFERIDRFDVLDDTHDLFVQDAKNYILEPEIARHLRHVPPDVLKECLTVDDVQRYQNGQQFVIYDAFVLYVDADLDFAIKLIKTMEDDYKLNLCEKNRLLGGIEIERSAIIHLITKRSRKLLVILSTEFNESALHTSFVQFAQSLNYQQQSSVKVIPCIYKDCELSDDLRAYHVLDYRRCQDLVNFWYKLHQSLVPLDGSPERQLTQLPAISFTPESYPALPEPGRSDMSPEFDKLSTKGSKNKIAKVVYEFFTHKYLFGRNKNKKRAQLTAGA